MLWIIPLLALLALVAAWPWVAEALRRPLTKQLRLKAPGEFAELSDGMTHFQWFGPRSDRVIVLVHGLSSPSWVFEGLIRGLQMMRYRVLTYDLYARGFSDRVDGPQDLDLFTRQLGEVITASGIRFPVTLLGYSMGGAIATAFAAREPDRVDRLILVAPALIHYHPPRLLAEAAGRGKLGDWLWGLLGARLLRRSARDDAKGPTVITDLPARIEAELGRKGYLAGILASQRGALSEPLEDTIRELAAMYIPTLAIWGELDETIPLSAMGQFVQWDRAAHQVVIDGAGHGLTYTHPRDVISAIHTFLREVPDT